MEEKYPEISIYKGKESGYYQAIDSILKKIASSEICYVSFVRTYMEIIKEIEEQGINTDKIHFIDTVTSENFDFEIPPIDNCTFVQGIDFDKINSAIKSFSMKKPEGTIIFDNVSSLLFNTSNFEIIKFTQKLIENYRNNKYLYIYLEDSMIKKEDNKELLKDLNLFMKNTINY